MTSNIFWIPLAFVLMALISSAMSKKPKPVADENHYIFQDILPTNVRMRPTLANGHLGTTVKGQEIFVNAIFNGADVNTHRAIIPSPASFNINGVSTGEDITRTYTLNARQGLYSEVLSGQTFVLTHRIYAHRTRSRLLVVDLELTRNDATDDLVFNIDLNERLQTPDVDFTMDVVQNGTRRFRTGQILTAEQPGQDATQVFIYNDVVPTSITVPSSQVSARWRFLTSISAFNNDARTAFDNGAALNPDDLLAEHVNGWEDLWSRGAIDLVGDDKLARSIYGAMFYILSSVPTQYDSLMPYVGLSPSGLPYGEEGRDYYGHIFWDQETWMYPPVLSFHSNMAAILLDGRNRTQEAARANAIFWGNTGLQYPWEGAQTGAEVCPVEENSEKEIHISGDISHAVKLYIDSTGDSTGTYNDILRGIAEFWISRMTFNGTLQKYTILDVIPPDEYQRSVNNSAFTNAVAAQSIANAEGLLENPIPIEDIYIPLDEQLQYHPEFDGYQTGTLVKQADVILMGYPLDFLMPQTVRYNDLNIYQNVTDDRGPAMSWSMFSIGWLDQGETDLAALNIEKNYAHIMNEFQVWNEVFWGGGAANFITGCGGFLQMIINGYGGVRVRSDRMIIDPQFPPGVTSLSFTGLDYLQSEIDLEFDGQTLFITVREQAGAAPSLQYRSEDETTVVDLPVGDTVPIPTSVNGRARGFITRIAAL